MGKGGTRFVSEPIAVRAGRQRQTFSARELEQDMVVFQETGVHPEVERAIREHDSSPRVRPLPDFNQNRPFVFLEFAIAKNPIGRMTVELFNELNRSGVELMLNRCRSGSQDSLAKTSVHKLLTEFAFFFGKTSGTRQLTSRQNLNHIDKGTVSVSLDGSEMAITLTKDMTGLDSTHQVLGRVHLGIGILDRINDVISGPLDIPIDEIMITRCGMANHEGAIIGESSGMRDPTDESKSIEDSKKQLEEESKTTQNNLQSALIEGLHREQAQKRSKRKRNLLHHLSSSSSDSDD